MKKIILVAVATLVSLAAFGQSRFAVGAGASYAFDPELLGITLKGQYNVTEQIRPEASFTYFFEKNNVKSWAFDANFQYLFDLGTVNVYPLAGLSYIHYSIDVPNMPVSYSDEIEIVGGNSTSDGKLGINLGGGVEYPISENLSLAAELKLCLNKLYGDSSIVLGLGVTYRF